MVAHLNYTDTHVLCDEVTGQLVDVISR